MSLQKDLDFERKRKRLGPEFLKSGFRDLAVIPGEESERYDEDASVSFREEEELRSWVLLGAVT